MTEDKSKFSTLISESKEFVIRGDNNKEKILEIDKVSTSPFIITHFF